MTRHHRGEDRGTWYMKIIKQGAWETLGWSETRRKLGEGPHTCIQSSGKAASCVKSWGAGGAPGAGGLGAVAASLGHLGRCNLGGRERALSPCGGRFGEFLHGTGCSLLSEIPKAPLSWALFFFFFFFFCRELLSSIIPTEDGPSGELLGFLPRRTWPGCVLDKCTSLHS